MGYLSTIPILCPYVSILSRFVEGRTMLPAIAISSSAVTRHHRHKRLFTVALLGSRHELV